jgi:hypothetical protein
MITSQHPLRIVIQTPKTILERPWVWPVPVVEVLELAQGVEQVLLVPDQGPVEQLAATGQHPSLHDRVLDSASGSR